MIDRRLEEADIVMNEAKAIVSFLDEATDCLSRETCRSIDELHSEVGYGLHLCFVAALERIEKAKNMLYPEKAPEMRSA